MTRRYRTCPRCGASLDPSERCDCERDEQTKEDGTYDCTDSDQ
jgi:hypothetical protein